MNIIDLLKDNQSCYDFLFNIRWSNGIKCPYCQNNKIFHPTHKATDKRYICGDLQKKCRKKFSLFTGTYIQDLGMPLNKYLYIVYSFCKNPKISSRQLAMEISTTQRPVCYRLKALKKQIGDILDFSNNIDENFGIACSSLMNDSQINNLTSIYGYDKSYKQKNIV